MVQVALSFENCSLAPCTVFGDAVSRALVLEGKLIVKGRLEAWPTPDGYELREDKKLYYQPFIEARSNSAITGGGVIDGRADEYWWKQERTKLKPPRLVRVVGSNVEISDVAFVRSPFWTIHLFGCSNVLVSNVTIDNLGGTAQTDGIDVDSCRNTLLTDLLVSVRDDAISYKATRGPSEHHVARRIVARGDRGRGGSIAVGSETQYGIRDVLVENSTVTQASAGILLKTSPSRGGYMKDLVFRHITIFETHRPLYLDAWYSIDKKKMSCCHNNTNYGHGRLVDIANITFDKIVAHDWEGLRGSTFLGHPAAPFTDLFFHDVNLSSNNYHCCCAFCPRD